jgi:hypothetical protein
LTIKLLDVFHGEGAIISRNGTRLSHRMNVSHVIDGRRWVGMEGLNISINVLSPKN